MNEFHTNILCNYEFLNLPITRCRQSIQLRIGDDEIGDLLQIHLGQVVLVDEGLRRDPGVLRFVEGQFDRRRALLDVYTEHKVVFLGKTIKKIGRISKFRAVYHHTGSFGRSGLSQPHVFS